MNDVLKFIKKCLITRYSVNSSLFSWHLSLSQCDLNTHIQQFGGKIVLNYFYVHFVTKNLMFVLLFSYFFDVC